MNYLSHVLLHDKEKTLLAVVPNNQLRHQSLHLVAPEKKFKEWSAQNHADSYLFMQRIIKVWESSSFTNEYLIYGKVDSTTFIWEMIPYKKCWTFIERAFQQIQVLWRTAFGGMKVPEKERENQFRKYELLLKEIPEITEPSDISKKGDDAFCKEDTIERQWVIIGNKVNVLFNYAPIGFGGEPLHFLIVPKKHHQTFNDVTQEEYCESIDLTRKLIEHFTKTRGTVTNVYLLNKTGINAGQTVNHWHLHVIFCTNKAQDFWGKITVIKNILLGSSPMKKDVLTNKIKTLREELAILNT